jgi:hypothetical protein
MDRSARRGKAGLGNLKGASRNDSAGGETLSSIARRRPRKGPRSSATSEVQVSVASLDAVRSSG